MQITNHTLTTVQCKVHLQVRWWFQQYKMLSHNQSHPIKASWVRVGWVIVQHGSFSVRVSRRGCSWGLMKLEDDPVWYTIIHTASYSKNPVLQWGFFRSYAQAWDWSSCVLFVFLIVKSCKYFYPLLLFLICSRRLHKGIATDSSQLTVESWQLIPDCQRAE